MFNFKVSSVETLSKVKLACCNQFQERQHPFFPDGIKISITDNMKKKPIALIKNDAQLLKAQCIGYLCTEEESVLSLNYWKLLQVISI